MRQLTIAGRVAHVLARDLDEIKNRRIVARLSRQRSARDDHTRATVALALVIERELDFRADGKRPLGDEAHAVGRQRDFFPGQLDLVRKADGDRRPAPRHPIASRP